MRVGHNQELLLSDGEELPVHSTEHNNNIIITVSLKGSPTDSTWRTLQLHQQVWWAGRSPVCEDVLEADEGLGERVEFVHGGVDAVETRAALRHLLTVGDGEEEPAVDLKRLPVGRSHRLQREEQ